MAGEQARSEFEAIFLPHFGRAYALARWFVRHSDDAEDMVQDAYLKAYRSFASYNGGDSLAYILAIVRNTCLTHLRRTKSWSNVVSLHDRARTDGDEAGIEQVADPAPLAEDVLISNAERSRVRSAIWSLPEQFREVIVLRELEGLTYAQIAEVAGVPVGTVMSRLARARDRLRAQLEVPTSNGGRNDGLS